MSRVEEFTQESMRRLDREGCIILDDEEVGYLCVTRLATDEFRVSRNEYVYERGLGYVMDMDGDSQVTSRGRAESFVRTWHDTSEQIGSL